MLAKMWKKVLLGICIIACIFNLMAKLVNRHSLESNLRTANDGNTVLDALKKEDSGETTNIIENENINNDTEQSENNTNTEKFENSNNKQNENNSANSENKENEEDIDITDFFDTDEYNKKNENKVFRYTDYTIVF